MAHSDSVRFDLGSAEPLLYRHRHQGQPAEAASSSRPANLSASQQAAAACIGHMTHAPPEPDCLRAARQGTLRHEFGLAMTALLRPDKLTQDAGITPVLWLVCYSRLKCRTAWCSVCPMQLCLSSLLHLGRIWQSASVLATAGMLCVGDEFCPDFPCSCPSNLGPALTSSMLHVHLGRDQNLVACHTVPTSENV